MRISFIACLLAIFSSFAHAAPSRVWWPQWKIQSSEELWEEVERKYSSYPIPLMLDGDAKTAWVYSATSKEFDKSTFGSRYGFVLTPSTPITLDSLRLMNGQNFSRARFFANHRAVKVRVTQELPDKKKIVTETKLSDTMGWHSIKLPRHKIKSLKVEFLDFRKGNSKNSDVCISELELRDKSKKIDWRMPRALMFYDGLEGCGASLLISRNGKVLDSIAIDEGYDDQWNSSGRYVAGFSGGGNANGEHLWVADIEAGKIIRKIKTLGHGANYQWRNAQTLMIEFGQGKKFRRRFLKAPKFQ